MMGEPVDPPRRAGEFSRRRDELNRLLRRHHGIAVDDVLQTIGYLRDEGDCVIAGGSLAFGMGNRLSDLDIVVAGGATSQSSRVPLEHFAASLRIDVWKMNRRLIDDLFVRAAEGLAGNDRLHESFANVDDETNLKLLHRIAFGTLLDGPDLAPACDCDPRTIARALVVREYAERMRESAFLAQLALDADDHVAATVNARLSVEEALHATIAARGLPFTGDKWLRERLEHDAPDLLPLHSRFEALPNSDNPSRDAFVRAAVQACGELTGVALDVTSLAAMVTWEVEGIETIRVGAQLLLVAPATGAMWSLDTAEDAVWANLSVEGGLRRWACVPADLPTMALSYRLHAQGLASLRWTHGQSLSGLTLNARVMP